MNRKLLGLLLTAAVMSAAALTGCGQSGGSTAAGQNQSVAKTADVTVSATFPTAGGAVKSLIPTATKAIYVYFSQTEIYSINNVAQGGYSLKLTATTPTGTLKLAPGSYYVYAGAFDSTEEEPTTKYPMGRMIAQTSTAGVINLGSNTVNLTFLNGVWTMVDANGAASPIELSNGTKLNDIVVGGGYGGHSTFKKAAFDFTKPIGGSGGEGNTLKYRFNNNTSARASGEFMSQFIGTENSTAIFVDNYNLTKKCAPYSSYGEQNASCEEAAGDQVVFIQGMPAGTGAYDTNMYTDNGVMRGYAEQLLPNNGRSKFTQNGTPIDFESASSFPAATVSGGNLITGNLMEIVVSGKTTTLSTTPSPAKVAAKASAKVVKAQSSNTPYTNVAATDYEIMICATKSTPSKGTWYFNGQPVTVGTATCYQNGYIMNYDPANNYQQVTPNAGDYSYGLVPTDSGSLGDYCHVWDYNQTSGTYNTCKQQKPGTGEIYLPYNFTAKKTDTKTSIDYGSFKLNFHVQKTTSGTVYVYPFRARGTAQ